MEHTLNEALFIILPNLMCFFGKKNPHFILVQLIDRCTSMKCGSAKDLLSIMDNVETKIFSFLTLLYILDFLNKFNAHFQSLETRIHELQPKSLTLLYKICQNLKKNERIQCFSVHILFRLKKNQRNLDKINLGSECQEYLNELMMQRHENVVIIVRSNFDVLCDCC